MNLKLVHPIVPTAGTVLPEIKVALALHGKDLLIDYAIQSTQPCYTNTALKARDGVLWDLWQWDVVEIFLRTSAKEKTYYEFQVSPLNQALELEIIEPRKKVNDKVRTGFRHSVERDGVNSWKTRIEIPLQKINWDGNASSLKGNIFAILGDPKIMRSYWALSLPQQEVPDFHLPQHFQTLMGGED